MFRRSHNSGVKHLRNLHLKSPSMQNGMEVQCYAWVNFEGDNKTQIVNIEEVTTFDVGIRKLTESSVIFHVN